MRSRAARRTPARSPTTGSRRPRRPRAAAAPRWSPPRERDQRLAYEEAATFCERALDVLDDPPTNPRRGELLLTLGDARMRAGEAAARDAFTAAAALGRTAATPSCSRARRSGSAASG